LLFATRVFDSTLLQNATGTLEQRYETHATKLML